MFGFFVVLEWLLSDHVFVFFMKFYGIII